MHPIFGCFFARVFVNVRRQMPAPLLYPPPPSSSAPRGRPLLLGPHASTLSPTPSLRGTDRLFYIYELFKRLKPYPFYPCSAPSVVHVRITSLAHLYTGTSDSLFSSFFFLGLFFWGGFSLSMSFARESYL